MLCVWGCCLCVDVCASKCLHALVFLPLSGQFWTWKSFFEDVFFLQNWISFSGFKFCFWLRVTVIFSWGLACKCAVFWCLRIPCVSEGPHRDNRDLNVCVMRNESKRERESTSDETVNGNTNKSNVWLFLTFGSLQVYLNFQTEIRS